MQLPRARPVVIGVALVLAVVACSGEEDEPVEPITAELILDEAPDEEPEPEEDDEPVLAGRAPLTGVAITEEAEAELLERPAVLAKIDNAGPARPQTGLDEADVVFEELVEGGVTRFIAVFHSVLPEQVGPVRSARPVDVEVGSGFGAPVFVFSGARPEVQSLLRGSPMVTFEEGQVSGFERVRDRRSPHNLFAAPEAMLAAGQDRDAAAVPDLGWAFDDDAPDGEVVCEDDCDDPGREVQVAMSRSSSTTFTYDEDDGVYRRLQNGREFVVTGDGVVGAANVVVLATRHYIGGCCDTSGSAYAETEVIGGDRAIVLRDGRRYEARWEKPSREDPLRILDEDGEPFPLRPGPTWLLLPSASALD